VIHKSGRMPRPAKYWTKERCAEAAANFATRPIFKKCLGGAYEAARVKGWLDDIAPPSRLRRKRRATWTKTECLDEAIKYSQRKHFYERCRVAYDAARYNGWLTECCAHMEATTARRLPRYVYVLKFSGKRAYVGLSYNVARRISQHKSCGRALLVQKALTRETPEVAIHGPLEVKEAARLEVAILREYRCGGWALLNKNRGGATGAAY